MTNVDRSLKATLRQLVRLFLCSPISFNRSINDLKISNLSDFLEVATIYKRAINSLLDLNFPSSLFLVKDRERW